MTATTHTVPAGWKLVPVEPTNDMLDETDVIVGGCYLCSAQRPDWGQCAEIYADMLRAAPVPPEPVDASLFPCGDCGKSVKEACDNRPCGYRAMQQQGNAAAPAPPAAAPLSVESLTDAVKELFPDRAYQAYYFARELLESPLSQVDSIDTLDAMACALRSQPAAISAKDHWEQMTGRAEQSADRIAALEAKCALLAASLKQADALRDQLVASLKDAYPFVSNDSIRWQLGDVLKAAGAIK